MTNESNNGKKRVSRQFWKPNKVVNVLHGVWSGIYSVLKIALGAFATVLVIAGVCLVVFVGILGDYLENDILPQAGMELEGMDLDQDSYIYYVDSQGNIQTLQKIYAETSTEWVNYEDIPEHLIQATVAIEDKRFYKHQGVDWIRTVSACLNMFMGGNSQFGGSSITQQLVKNVLLVDGQEDADDVTVQRKVLEIFRATELEKRYDKTVIMEWYLNNIYLGNRCAGVKTAAAKYFGKELEFLTPAESACLISITNNPSKFNPYRTNLDGEGKTGMEQNDIRRTNTLWVMRNEGYLTEEEYQEALAQQIVLKDGIDEQDRVSDCSTEGCGYHGKVSSFIKKEDGQYYCPSCGNATAVGLDASQNVYSWFVDTVLEDVGKAFAERDGVAWNDATREIYMNLISRGGYHIYSTLNMDVQNQVDKIYTNLDEIPADRSGQQLQSSIVVVDNQTGDIVAMSGGVGEKDTFDAYNRAEANLQPGSSIKPLTIYAPAFEMGIISPASVVKDMPLKYLNAEDEPINPFPKNDGRTYSYSRTIRDGVVSSVNGIAVNTLSMVGTGYSFSFAKEQFGLSTLVEHYENSNGKVFTDIDWSPLGMGAPTLGVSVRAMSTAYAAFANDGVYREARTFTKIYNSNGEVVLHNDQDSRRILSEKTINYMNYCLDCAVAWGTGTAADLRNINIDVCGKTGTTASMKDRWFCGFTNYYTAAVWCGYDHPEVINLVGDYSNPACRLWKKVMQPLHTGKPSQLMYDDSEFKEIYICLDTGLLATDACRQDARGSRVSSGFCMEEDAPTQVCNKHIMVDWCSASGQGATEYCKNFASVGQTSIVKHSLAKMTQKDVDDIFAATQCGLDAVYLRPDYVYLVDSNGKPVSFHGIDGLANDGLDHPHVICTTHTKATWNAYLNTLQNTDEPSPNQNQTLPAETEYTEN